MTLCSSSAHDKNIQRSVSQPWLGQFQAPVPRHQYQILGELGKGAYGTVYHAQDVITLREYAMKTILMRIGDEGIPQNLLREISTLKALQRIEHPNITRMHDVVATSCQRDNFDMCVNVIYEKCDWDLYEFLKMIPRDMSDMQCRHFARQLFCGLDFLHSHGVVHRDIKPQNILINRDHTLKITDFGLARTYAMHSCFTTVVVTLWYRSPELLLQCKYNASIDIWSAGCILVELYTRQPLFCCNTEVQQLKTIFQKLGTPRPEMWPQEAAVDCSSFPIYAPVALERLAPQMAQSPHAIDLALQTLNFSPFSRPTAAECLMSSYFHEM
uniref:cyclin-dependent kinase n=1 Tax=Steinernema glaseri TaxID=37863 RepID=A0A1I7ZH04_9BILA